MTLLLILLCVVELALIIRLIVAVESAILEVAIIDELLRTLKVILGEIVPREMITLLLEFMLGYPARSVVITINLIIL